MFQRCTWKGKSPRLVGWKAPFERWTLLSDHILTIIVVVWQEVASVAQPTKAPARTLPREPSLPRQSEISWLFFSQHIEHKEFLQTSLNFSHIFSFSILAQGLVHPKPHPDRSTVGECHTQPLFICCHYHSGAYFRLPEAQWWVKKIKATGPKDMSCYCRVISTLSRNTARSGGSRSRRGRGGGPESKALGSNETKRAPTTGTDNLLPSWDQDLCLTRLPQISPLTYQLPASRRRLYGKSFSGGCPTLTTKRMRMTAMMQEIKQQSCGEERQRAAPEASETSPYPTKNSWSDEKGN